MRRGGGRESAAQAGGRATDPDPFRQFIEAGSLRVSKDRDGDTVGLTIADPFPAELRPQALLAFGARHTSTLQSVDLGGAADFSEQELDECIGWLGHVSRLAVPHGLSDRMAARVRKLTGLRTLDLSSLPENGPAPATWIEPLAWLEHLVLGPAATDTDLAAVGRLESLRRLEIVGNRRVTDSGFAAVAHSGSLAEVSIWLSSIGPDGLASLAMLESLRRLALDGVTVAPGHFEAFAGRRLESLELPAGLRDRSGLELLVRVAPGVNSLSLSGWALADDDLALLPALRSLETLRLAGCEWLSDAGLEHVGRVASLRSIDLTSCLGISARGIASLRHLSLDDLRIPPLPSSDESLATLVDRCRRVRDELVITESDTRPETVRRAIERWQPGRIVLHGRQFDDSLLDTLAANTNLRHLEIAGTAISAAVVTRFAGKRLDTLELPARLRTDASLPGWLAAVRVGRDFDLTRWRITPAAVASLPLTADEGRPFRLLRLPPAARDEAALGEWLRRQPPRGSRLDLRGWRITDASLPMLAALEQVTRLDLRGTLISAEGLAAFEGRVLQGLRLPRACATPSGQIRRRMLLGKTERIRLNLSGQALAADDVRALARARPREVVLTGLEAISAETLAALRAEASQFTALEKLVLAGAIGDGVIDIVEALPAVRRLDLSATAVTDAGLRRLRDRDLEELEVPRECRGPGGSLRAFVGDIQEPPGTVVNSIGMQLVPIAPGKFRMGAGKEDPHAISREEHPHTVEITRPFLIGMHAVTQAEFQRVMNANPSLTRGDTHPVDHVEWQAAVDFCERLSALPEEQSAGRSYRLPTEAEWEYCCRAGTATPWNVGVHLPRHRARFASGVRREPAETVPVGTYPPNAWGLYEMHGNVWEWTSDWYGFEYYENSRRINPFGPVSGTHHTARGGSASVQDHECRSAIRGEANDDVIGANCRGLFGQLGNFGLRVVCEVPVSAGLPTRTHRILDRHLGSEEAGQVGMGLALLRASGATDADIREAISSPVLRWILKNALLDGVRPEILEPLTACLGRSDAVREEWEVMVACGFADRPFVRRSLDDPDRRLPIIEALAKRPALAPLHELLSQQPAAPGIALDSLTTLSAASAKRLAKHKGPVSLKGLESVSDKVRGILDAAKNITWKPAAAPAPPAEAASPQVRPPVAPAGSVANFALNTDSRTVRIFISSTFRDFVGERDLLVRKVFPELRRRCRERQVELVDVDLRWGITEAEAEQGKVLPICLAEIDRARPFFMGLLGERYGWVPAAGQFDRSLLIEQPWLEEHAGGKSVTELEILHGVLNNPEMAGRAFFYFRDPAWSATQGADYATGSQAERQKLADLKDRIRTNGFPVVEDYADPEALAERVREDLWSLIDAAYPEADVPDPLTLERRRHEAYAASRRRLYLGGERYFEALDEELAAELPRPVLVRGKSGGGKSALLANWLARWSQAHPDTAVIVHHLGCGADAADPVRMAVRIMQEIAQLVAEEFKPKSDPDEQLDELATWLATASAWAGRTGRNVLLVLDGLDKLADRRHLRWFPTVLPSGVRLVVSCLDGEVLEAALIRLSWRELVVEPFTEAEQTHFIGEYLGRFRKQLTAEQTRLLQGHPLVGNPLFLLTVLEELRVFGVHEELDQRLATLLSPPPSKQPGEEPTVDDAFEHVLARIEADHGREAVQRVMEAIWASRAGLYTDEILAIAKVSPATWAGIANALDESLYETSGRINFGHDYLRKAVEDRYGITGDTRLALHRRLAEYFGRLDSSDRVAEEIPWQWEKAGDRQHLHSCLVDWSLFPHLIRRDHGEILNYWRAVSVQNLSAEYEQAVKRWEGRITLAHLLVGNFLYFAGYYDNFVERLYRTWLSVFPEKSGPENRPRLECVRELSALLLMRGKAAEAAELLNAEWLATDKALPVDDPLALELMSCLSCSLMAIGHTDAEAVSRDLIDRLTRLGQTSSRGYGLAMYNLGFFLFKNVTSQNNQEVLLEVDVLMRTSYAVLREAVGPQHIETLRALAQQASVHVSMGRFDDALAVSSEAYDQLCSTLGPDHPEALVALSMSGLSLVRQGKAAEAEAIFRQVASGNTQIAGGSPEAALVTYLNLGESLEAQGRTDEAREFYLMALEGAHAELSPSLAIFKVITEQAKRALNGRYECSTRLAVAGRAFLERFGGASTDPRRFIDRVEIAAGVFAMGSDASDANRSSDERQVVVDITRAFEIGATCVTQGQWRAVMGTEPWIYEGLDISQCGDDFPAVYVCWDDAVKFCEVLTELEREAGVLPPTLVYRLPTEAEWEYVCRAGATTRYCFGDDMSQLDGYGWSSRNAGGSLHRVAELSANAWGVYDMHGNVWEWCADGYVDVLPGGVDPLVAHAGDSRVTRGGSFAGSPQYSRAACRRFDVSRERRANIGFRCVCGEVNATPVAGEGSSEGRHLCSVADIVDGSIVSKVDAAMPEGDGIDELCVAVRNAESLLYDCHYGSDPESNSREIIAIGHSQARRLLDTAEHGFVRRSHYEEDGEANSDDEARELRDARRRHMQVICECRALMAEKEGECEYAHTLLEDGLAMAEGFWGESHVELLPVLKAVVTTAKTFGDWARGLAAARRGLKICLNAAGPMHPDIRWWLHTYCYCERAIDLGELTRAEEHATDHSRALQLMERGDYAAAETLLRSVLKGSEQSLNADHLDTPKTGNHVEIPLEKVDDDAPLSVGRSTARPAAVSNAIGMTFVPIPAGEFFMGSPESCPHGDPEEEFRHRVRITRPFLLCMHQVTQSQYEKVTGKNPSFFKGPDLPVEHLSWQEAQRFCELLSSLPEERAAGRRYRLPTEAEWEYACRAGTTAMFNTGDTLEMDQARFATTSRSSPKATAPVGSYPPNAWGLFDMHGNVWEWTSDWFSADYFRESPVDDPQGPATGSHHTLRGGSASVEAHECRSAIRGEASAVDGPETETGNRYARYGDFGIRVVCVDSQIDEEAARSEHSPEQERLARPGTDRAGDDAHGLGQTLQDWRMVSEAQRAGRLESFQRLADRLVARGDRAAAARLYSRALEGCEMFLGVDHPASEHYRRLHAECIADIGSRE